MNRETIRSLIRPFFIALGLSTMVGSGCYMANAWLWEMCDYFSHSEQHFYYKLALAADNAFYPLVAGCFVFTFALTARAPSRRSPA